MADPMKTPAVAVRTITDAQCKRAAEQICKQVRRSMLSDYVAAGRIIITECYEGLWTVWNARNEGDQALSRVAEVLRSTYELNWSDTKLFRAVRVAEQTGIFQGFNRWPSLSVHHVIAVQGLSWQEQERLFRLVEEEGWTTRQLVAEVAGLRGVKAPGSERRAGVSARTALRKLDAILDDRHELSAMLGEAGLPPAKIAAFVEALEPVHRQLEDLMTMISPVPRRKQPTIKKTKTKETKTTRTPTA